MKRSMLYDSMLLTRIIENGHRFVEVKYSGIVLNSVGVICGWFEIDSQPARHCCVLFFLVFLLFLFYFYFFGWEVGEGLGYFKVVFFVFLLLFVCCLLFLFCWIFVIKIFLILIE